MGTMNPPKWGRPTSYKGIRMRSRLEASVAAYLDDCGAEWLYEPQCFADETGQYLPDFYIPDWGDLYVEVKPELDESVVASVAPKMEIIFSSHHPARLEIWAPDPAMPKEWFYPLSAKFHRGGWYIDEDKVECWQGGRW